MIVLLIIILVFIVAGVAANTVFFALAMKKLGSFDAKFDTKKEPDAGIEGCLSDITGGINEIKQMIDEMPAREMGVKNWEDFSTGLNNIMSYGLDDAYRKPGDMK